MCQSNENKKFQDLGFVRLRAIVVAVFQFQSSCKKIDFVVGTPRSHNKRDYHTCETRPIVDDFETYEPDIPDKNAVKGTPWEEEEFGIRGGSKASIHV